jgi:hypothetical protein
MPLRLQMNFARPLPSLAILIKCLAIGWVIVAARGIQ